MAPRQAADHPDVVFEEETTAPRKSSPEANRTSPPRLVNAATPLFDSNTGRAPAVSRPAAPRASTPPRTSSIPPHGAKRGHVLVAAVALLVAFVLGVGAVALFDWGFGAPRAKATHHVVERMPWTVVWEYFFPPKGR